MSKPRFSSKLAKEAKVFCELIRSKELSELKTKSSTRALAYLEELAEWKLSGPDESES